MGFDKVEAKAAAMKAHIENAREVENERKAIAIRNRKRILAKGYRALAKADAIKAHIENAPEAVPVRAHKRILAKAYRERRYEMMDGRLNKPLAPMRTWDYEASLIAGRLGDYGIASRYEALQASADA